MARPLVTFDVPVGGDEGRRKSRFGDLMSSVRSAATNVAKFVGGVFSNEAEDDDVPVVMPEVAGGANLDVPERSDYRGADYQLSYRYYRDPEEHEGRAWYFTSQLGDPFPSYHTNPEPFFPPRWTNIPDVKNPVESITAPRIRLGPRELEQRSRLLEALKRASGAQTHRPAVRTLNLSHQQLGDPYQIEALRLMLSMNREVQVLNLDANELTDICDIELNNVRRLYVARNNLASFMCLPPMPELLDLVITENFIMSVRGLTPERFPKLRKISIHGNPICTNQRHREVLIGQLPTLQMVDWFPRSKILEDM